MLARFAALWLSYIFAVVILWVNIGEAILLVFWNQLVSEGHFWLFPSLISLGFLLGTLFFGYKLFAYSIRRIGTTTQIVE